MADLSGANKNAAWTPRRTSEIVFGYRNEDRLVEPALWKQRARGNIAPVARFTSNVEQLASGTFILKPTCSEFSNAALDPATVDFGTIRKASWQTLTSIEEIPMWRKATELTGVLTSVSPDVVDEGDYWMRKRVPSSGTYDESLTPSILPVTLPSADLVMDRALEYTDFMQTQEQGYLLRWHAFGAPQDHPDFLLTFYFGGRVDILGHGQFALALSGTGIAYLYEMDDVTWQLRRSWRYVDQDRAYQGAHSVRIIPHGGTWIEFRHQSMEEINRGPVLTSRERGPSQITQSAVYLHTIRPGAATERASGDGAERFATGAGSLAVDIRRDQRIDFQVNRVLYRTGESWKGIVHDDTVLLGQNLVTTKPFHVRAIIGHWTVLGTLVTHSRTTVYDATTLLSIPAVAAAETEPFTATARTLDGYAPPSPIASVQCAFDLWTDDERKTPLLLSYTVERREQRETVPWTSQTALADKHIREVSIMGQEGADPTQESASFRLIDRTAELSLIANTGQVPTVIRTTYADPADATKKSVVFAGYTERANAHKRGIPRLRSWGTGTTSAFKDWVNYDATAKGMWMRLHQKLFHGYQNFSDANTGPEGGASGTGAPTSPDGIPEPWKVTDALRQVIYDAGWPMAMIDIPDQPMRLWSNADKNSIDLLLPVPWMRAGDWVAEVCLGLMGGWITFDANAGAAGMWRFKRFPYGDETIRWKFVTAPASVKLPHRLDSYPAITSPVKRNTYRSYVVPPEANYLRIYGLDKDNPGHLLTQELYNEKSFNIDPANPTADDTDPDYLGERVEIYQLNTNLFKQQMVDWYTRRIANVAMRGFRMVELVSHLVFVQPSDDTQYSAGVYRPLLFGDLVHLDGVKYMVRGVSPAWRNDRAQLARYELQQWRKEKW